ncbi:hypothetical protein [Rhodococcus jostii]|uniref:hypothetical protein n=1 Tax=Rhodococcus jostii TaxID=132919 RepID=UPI000AFDB2EE|nr:hypothetical protein [Rhodococcus jostii]
MLRWSNTLVWRCPSERLLAHYNSHLGDRHLDIGPGTGWYLRRATYPTPNPMVELLDLNPNTLQMTTTRLADRGITAAAHTGRPDRRRARVRPPSTLVPEWDP